MALSRAHVWNPGDILRSADLNGEFNNILLNPIALLSPTTGQINFASNQSLNFALENLAVVPAVGTVGRIYFNTARSQVEVTDGTNNSLVVTLPSSTVTLGDLIVGTASNTFTRLPIGSTGQVLTVTSSSTAPSWQTPTALTQIASIGAWANVTTSAIINSANVASIATTAVGTIEATWTTPFQNGVYVINVTALSTAGREVYARVNRMSSSSATLSIHDQNGTLQPDTFLFTVVTSS